jgi:CheY-like chemotaxis protein
MADTAVVSRGLVLLAEDEDSVRSMVRRMLERAGFDVIEARNGFDAITIARSEQRCIDLLVTDVQMPGMQGPELSER